MQNDPPTTVDDRGVEEPTEEPIPPYQAAMLAVSLQAESITRLNAPDKQHAPHLAAARNLASTLRSCCEYNSPMQNLLWSAAMEAGKGGYVMKETFKTLFAVAQGFPTLLGQTTNALGTGIARELQAAIAANEIPADEVQGVTDKVKVLQNALDKLQKSEPTTWVRHP